MTTKEKTPPAAAGAPGAAAPGQDKPAAAGGDHVESLGEIARLGAQLDLAQAVPGAPGGPGVPDPAAIKAKAAAEISSALELLRMAAIPFAPPHTQAPLELVWSDKQLLQIAEAIVDLCDAQGISVDDWFTKNGPWIRLAMALGVPAVVTLKLLKSPAPEPAPADPKPAPAGNGQQQ